MKKCMTVNQQGNPRPSRARSTCPNTQAPTMRAKLKAGRYDLSATRRRVMGRRDDTRATTALASDGSASMALPRHTMIELSPTRRLHFVGEDYG